MWCVLPLPVVWQDDEETLAAEEALAAKDKQAGGVGELDELDEEANLPLEELLAR